AHSKPLMAYLECLPWGVRWEISRYVTNIDGFDIQNFNVSDFTDLRRLGNNAAAAPEVREKVKRLTKELKSAHDQFAGAYAKEQSARVPWQELDREDEILCKHEHGALGCNDEETYCKDDPGWYGGKVHFTAKLVASSKGPDEFSFVLARPALGSSNRFMRRRGSKRFIRVLIQKDALMRKGDKLSEFFRRPLVINGAVFRAFFAKEQNVFYVRTDEVVRGFGQDLRVVPARPSAQNREWSFLRFIKWHNDYQLNQDQTMSKWAARFALGLSNSVPGIRIGVNNIKYADDIICPTFNPHPDGDHAKPKRKPPSEMQMTDGCGLANRALMQALYGKFPAWSFPPTAVQCRIGGAKGLLLECILPECADPAQRTLDVLRTSRLRCPAKLSAETITNFAENGVKFSALAALFRTDIETRVGALLNWGEERTDPVKYDADMKLLWHALAKEGGVMAARLARENNGTARAAGYVVEDADEEELDDEDGLTQLGKELLEHSSAWWEDPVSGCPSSLEETCMALLDSGFRPDTCNVLRAKLAEVARKAVRTFTTRYRFAVPMSCSAFIVPDPYGVLQPGQIHVKSSQRKLPDQKGGITDTITGEVLVTRHPCKVPSDVQKVEAVEHPRLSHYVDVIVVSTKSAFYNGESLDCHLASLTGGGDYDGDTMEVFWDPTIVKDFVVPDPRVFGKEPPKVQASLLKNAETVGDFIARLPAESTDEFEIYSLQRYLLGALQDKSLVGLYSTWWENSTYHNGYDHPDTVFLAYMFCAILDGSKTGVTVKPEVHREHCSNRVWQSRCPKWKETAEAREHLAKPNENNLNLNLNLTRQPSLPPFVMDHLRFMIIEKKCQEEYKRIEQRLSDERLDEDKDLSRPWYDACERAALQEQKQGVCFMQEDLEVIRKHVEEVFDDHKKKLGQGQGKAFTDLRIEKRQDILRSLSKKFHAKPEYPNPEERVPAFSDHDEDRIKASYAYVYDRKMSYKTWSRFPWNVAMRALCDIKAHALGFPKTVAHDFYHVMRIDRGYLRKHGEESTS
ncbi:RNA dependent RNA polymerase-domain-containing protein, partial [Daedaleopsis nitida]